MNQREEREMVAATIKEFDGNVHTLQVNGVRSCIQAPEPTTGRREN